MLKLSSNFHGGFEYSNVLATRVDDGHRCYNKTNTGSLIKLMILPYFHVAVHQRTMLYLNMPIRTNVCMEMLALNFLICLGIALLTKSRHIGVGIHY